MFDDNEISEDDLKTLRRVFSGQEEQDGVTNVGVAGRRVAKAINADSDVGQVLRSVTEKLMHHAIDYFNATVLPMLISQLGKKLSGLEGRNQLIVTAIMNAMATSIGQMVVLAYPRHQSVPDAIVNKAREEAIETIKGMLEENVALRALTDDYTPGFNQFNRLLTGTLDKSSFRFVDNSLVSKPNNTDEEEN